MLKLITILMDANDETENMLDRLPTNAVVNTDIFDDNTVETFDMHYEFTFVKDEGVSVKSIEMTGMRKKQTNG